MILILILFITETDICNDTTLYDCRTYLHMITNKLRLETNIDTKWLKSNEMVANPSNIQLMFLVK